MTAKATQIETRPFRDWAGLGDNELNQTELLSRARRSAVNEAGAAMLHELNGPLNALLVYLREIKREQELAAGAGPIPSSMRQVLEKAFHETEHVREIVGRIASGGSQATFVGSFGDGANRTVRADGAAAHGQASGAPLHSGRHPLTAREREVLGLISGGASNKEGAHRLQISTRTFEAHRAQIMRKLGARNAADLVRMTLSGTR